MLPETEPTAPPSDGAEMTARRARTRDWIARVAGLANGVVVGLGWAALGTYAAVGPLASSRELLAGMLFAWPAVTWTGFHLAWGLAGLVLRAPEVDRTAALQAADVALHWTVPVAAVFALVGELSTGFHSTPDGELTFALVLALVLAWAAISGGVRGLRTGSGQAVGRRISEVAGVISAPLSLCGMVFVGVSELGSTASWLLIPLVVPAGAVARLVAVQTGR